MSRESLTEVSRWGKLINFEYDYVAVSYPDAVTETYLFKQNGASGTSMGTITVVYTDSTKASISTIART